MNIKSIFFIIVLIGHALYGATHSGTLEEEIDSASVPDLVTVNPIHFYSSSALYVNGGLTFTFPTNLFAETPNVTVSIQSTSFASSLLSARITSSSNTSVTISVNAGSLLSITELLSGAATVSIWAVGQ